VVSLQGGVRALGRLFTASFWRADYAVGLELSVRVGVVGKVLLAPFHYLSQKKFNSRCQPKEFCHKLGRKSWNSISGRDAVLEIPISAIASHSAFP